jgi:hypothetical protein
MTPESGDIDFRGLYSPDSGPPGLHPGYLPGNRSPDGAQRNPGHRGII